MAKVADERIQKIESKLFCTLKDIDRLTAICKNLSRFIGESCGEDRLFLEGSLKKFQSLKSQAEKRVPGIRDALAQAATVVLVQNL